MSRKEITQKEHKLLYKSAKDEKLYLPLEKIESIFWRAMNFVESITNIQAVRRYWRFEHNKILMSKKSQILDEKLLKECMIIPCEVLLIDKDNATVKSEFFDDYIKLKIDFVNVKPGDKVTKHYSYACEKISKILYLKMVENLKKISNIKVKR